MRILTYMCVAMALTACQPVVDRAKYLAEESKTSFWKAVDSLEEALHYEPDPQPQLPPERYCYRAVADVVCYDEPRYESTIGALEGSQGTERAVAAQPVYQSVPAESVRVSEAAPVAGNDAAFDPEAPEPLVGF